MKPDPLATLAAQFAMLSLVAVGGANAVLPAMHRLSVTDQGWLSDREFADLFALANAAPGPNVLIVTLIGFKVAGVTGGLVATAAMCAPSCLLTYAVSRLWDRHRAARWRGLVQQSLAPITIGLVLASAFVLCRAADSTVLAGALTAAVAAASLFSRFNPLWLLGAAALLGLAGIG